MFRSVSVSGLPGQRGRASDSGPAKPKQGHWMRRFSPYKPHHFLPLFILICPDGLCKWTLMSGPRMLTPPPTPPHPHRHHTPHHPLNPLPLFSPPPTLHHPGPRSFLPPNARVEIVVLPLLVCNRYLFIVPPPKKPGLCPKVFIVFPCPPFVF